MALNSDVTGFRAAPVGYLCEQRWDLAADLAYAHERARTYHKGWHTHNRTMLVCPLGAAQVRVLVRGEQTPFGVDASSVLWVQAQREHQTAARDDLYDVLALYPSDALIATMCNQVGAAHPCADRGAVRKERGPLLAALLQRFLEAAVGGGEVRSDLEINALGCLILCTALRCSQATDAAPQQPHSPILRVIAAIDADIDRSWTLGDLAKHGHVSAATLVRRFKASLGVSPMAYVQERRLQEAEHLLKRGTSVAETANIVGYQSPAAFCCAYRKRFGVAPSKVYRVTF